ncbi:hypothetical protein K469DRAFT_695731 [Zopfia rhizophila CBS 207.26]|uniref:Uncharacterized protein n=1 Tax=Zopfia rhizophila CBS 207.26 TaxID=1314779 RepID=A0A6A6DI55_9PEZI|nr:hypothetical protein K469DRAFT_695731 [Zopfia rhizophila CBS 207.26]
MHRQKRQEGFFKHPVLVVRVDDTYVYFYALTRVPPNAVADLNMCLRIDNTTEDEGLRANLEQRFRIELPHLARWGVDVSVAESEKHKLQRHLDWLESQQNRFIYKPLPRDLSPARVGAIVMLPNPLGSSTLGAPVVVIQNDYPHFWFLRIKAIAESQAFDEPRTEQYVRVRRNCLAISGELRVGHDGTPVMLLENHSPGLPEKSYIEISRRPKWHRLEVKEILGTPGTA